MAVSKRKRFEVFKRDGFTCQYCGRMPPSAILECDHIAPKSKGGSHGVSNLVTSCRDCNQGKFNVPLRCPAPFSANRANANRDIEYGEVLARAVSDGRDVGEIRLANRAMVFGALRFFGLEECTDSYLGSIGYEPPITVGDIHAFSVEMELVAQYQFNIVRA